MHQSVNVFPSINAQPELSGVACFQNRPDTTTEPPVVFSQCRRSLILLPFNTLITCSISISNNYGNLRQIWNRLSWSLQWWRGKKKKKNANWLTGAWPGDVCVCVCVCVCQSPELLFFTQSGFYRGEPRWNSPAHPQRSDDRLPHRQEVSLTVRDPQDVGAL